MKQPFGFVNWDFVDGTTCHWELLRADGSSAATVWENGVWHTWDRQGNGGENSKQASVGEAQLAATLSAINQGLLL